MRTTNLQIVLVSGLLLLGCSREPDETEGSIASPEVLVASRSTDEMVAKLKATLVITDTGMLMRLDADHATAAKLLMSTEEVEAVNAAIDEINAAVGRGEFVVQSDLENVARPLVLAGMGLLQCLAKIFECSALTAVCLAEGGACAACLPFCKATLGLGCPSCIYYFCVPLVPICLEAYVCWKDFYNDYASYDCTGKTGKADPKQE